VGLGRGCDESIDLIDRQRQTGGPTRHPPKQKSYTKREKRGEKHAPNKNKKEARKKEILWS
jgi:hypothetical protein